MLFFFLSLSFLSFSLNYCSHHLSFPENREIKKKKLNLVEYEQNGARINKEDNYYIKQKHIYY